ncbi:MAG TPA: TatD family hydrolase, partial [Ottowia sp.]|nr:TatD family hydrolase [Ottowia sp.]
MATWIDTHCHLDAPEFSADVAAVRARAATENVALCVIPAVEPVAFEAVRALA